MSIISATTEITGMVGVVPNMVFLNTNDTLATVATAGYLTQAIHEGLIPPLTNTDIVFVRTGTGSSSQVSPMTVSVTGNAPNLVYSLIGYTQASIVLNGGNFNATIVSANLGQATTFTLPDPGVAAANFLLTQSAGTQTIATGNLTLTLGNLLVSAGNITATTGAITASAGNVTAGSSGHAGALISFPATAARGFLRWAATTAGGAFNALFTTAALGQTSTFTVPDPGGAAAAMLLAPAALVNGNLIKASGTAGLTQDAGFFVKANLTAVWGGGATSNVFVANGITAGSIVAASIATSTTAVSITSVVPGVNQITVNFSADPGANTSVYYVATSAGV